MAYRIVRRTLNKSTGKPLSGYAVDITIRANGQGAYFLEDHNSDSNVMPHNDLAELLGTVVPELVRNHQEHFAVKTPPPGADTASTDV